MSEDLSKSDEKEEGKKDCEDGKGPKKVDDSEVIEAFLLLLPSVLTNLSNQKVTTVFSLPKIIEIPDESEKSPELGKKEVDATAEKEEKSTGNGEGGKEKEAEDASKDKEEKDKTSELDDAPAEVKAEGSDGKNSEAEVGKDEKMDTSSPVEEKKGTLGSERMFKKEKKKIGLL